MENKTTQNKIRKLLIEVWQILLQIKNNNGIKEIETGFLNKNIKGAQIRDLWEIYTGHLLSYGGIA